MARITFITPDRKQVVVTAESGSLMEAAVEAGVDGIYGDCGGVCSCATCHVRVRKDWMKQVGPAGGGEQDILELEDGADACSRLSCQIEVSDELEGLVVEIVEA